MSYLDYLLEEIVTANKILAREDVVDSFGHISVRHPDNPNHFLMSRARAPDCVEKDDIMEVTLEGELIGDDDRQPYLERFIHGTVFESRPDVHSVVHNHSPSVIPFGATGTVIKPIVHMAASIGHEVPIWDSQTKFGDTNLLIANLDMGRDFAQFMGLHRSALMRGHGSVVVGTNIRHAVHVSIYLELGARLQMEAMRMGNVTYLTNGEVDKIIARTASYTINRAWENWCRRAGRTPQEEWIKE